MKLRLSSIILFFILLQISCLHDQDNNQITYIRSDTIAIDIDNINHINKDQIESQEWIKLETTNESLIGDVSKIFYTNNLFIVLDNKLTNSVFIFDGKGNFISVINKLGKGPGEYTKIYDIAFDELNDVVHILDLNLEKILKYDIRGEFISEIDFDLISHDFGLIEPGYYAFFNAYNSPDGINELRNLTYLTENGKVYQQYFTYKKDFLHLGYGPRFNFSYFDNQLMFVPPFSNNVYNIDKDKCSLRYHFDFGYYSIPDNFLQNYYTSSSFIQNIRDSPYVIFLRNYCESNKLISFYIDIQDKHLIYLFNKSNHNMILSDLRDPLLLGSIPFAVDSEYVYQLIDISIFHKALADVEKNERERTLNRIKTDNPLMYYVLKNTKDNDNPIVRKLKVF